MHLSPSKDTVPYTQAERLRKTTNQESGRDSNGVQRLLSSDICHNESAKSQPEAMSIGLAPRTASDSSHQDVRK